MRAIRASRSRATRATARRRTSRLSPAVPLRPCTAARSVRCGAPGIPESPMSQAFVHLRVHTEYSLSDSVVRVPELVAAVAGMSMAAVAVTDEGNLFAMVKFYRAALKAGLKPIVGVDLQVAEAGEPRQPPTRVTLLCQSPAGYRNLTRLVSRAYLEGQERGTARIERGWLSPDALEGLIGLSCATEGDIGRALISARERDAERALDAWQALLPGRFYLELQRLGKPFEETYIAGAVALAARRGAPVVATNDVRFLEPGQFESHEARVCIHDGTLLADTGRVRRYSRQQYLRTPQEMAALFADLPEALANSAEIARRSSLQLTLGEVRLPQYPLPAGVSTEEFLREEAARGLAARFAASSGAPLPYRERLERELAVICQMGFAGYFLIVADFIRWAREHGVPVGPGRGSGAGSLVAYSLKITDLDPIRYDLLFERFLNPERVSLPDFDIDFCMDGRDRVIDYVARKYGRERVSQIITYGTMAAKAVVRDVGRVLGMAYGYVDRIAKLIPFELGITLDAALEREPELKRLYQSEDEVRNLIDLARSLEGLTRNAGMHAGGVVIAPSALTDFTPHHRNVPARIAQHAEPHTAAAAGKLRGHRGACDPLQAGAAAVRHGGRLHQPQARTARGADRLPASEPRTRPQAHLRRDPLPGAGHADRAGARRVHARRGGSAAPRDGQEEPRGDGAAALGVRRRRGGARCARGPRGAHLRSDGEVRRLRLQQIALGRLRAARVSDGVPEGPLARGVHGGRALGRHGSHRQGGDAHQGVQRHGTRGAAAGCQRLELRVHGLRREEHPLRPRRGARCGPGRGRGADRRAQRARCVHVAGGSVSPAGSAEGQPAGAGSAAALRQPRWPRRHSRNPHGAPGTSHASRRPEEPRPSGGTERPVRPRERGGRGRRARPRERRGPAGVGRGGAPRGRARDARTLSHRSSARALRVEPGPLRHASHRRSGQRPAGGRARGRALRRRPPRDRGRTHRRGEEARPAGDPDPR